MSDVLKGLDGAEIAIDFDGPPQPEPAEIVDLTITVGSPYESICLEYGFGHIEVDVTAVECTVLLPRQEALHLARLIIEECERG